MIDEEFMTDIFSKKLVPFEVLKYTILCAI